MNRRRDPYRLLVDTGASHTIFLPEIIQRLQPPEVGLGEQTSAGSPETKDTIVYHLDSLALQLDKERWIELPNVEVVALEWPRGLGVDGLLGMNYLEEFSQICLDFDALTLELHEAL